jgi:hypothetical protein
MLGAKYSLAFLTKFVARAAQAQANNQQIYLSARLDSDSRRQLVQQRLCCAFKCLGAVDCRFLLDWPT